MDAATATEVVECYIGRTGVGTKDPRDFSRVWPRCPRCNAPALGEVSFVNGVAWHRACYRAVTEAK